MAGPPFPRSAVLWSALALAVASHAVWQAPSYAEVLGPRFAVLNGLVVGALGALAASAAWSRHPRSVA